MQVLFDNTYHNSPLQGHRFFIVSMRLLFLYTTATDRVSTHSLRLIPSPKLGFLAPPPSHLYSSVLLLLLAKPLFKGRARLSREENQGHTGLEQHVAMGRYGRRLGGWAELGYLGERGIRLDLRDQSGREKQGKVSFRPAIIKVSFRHLYSSRALLLLCFCFGLLKFCVLK